MQPVKRKYRYAYVGGPQIQVADVKDESTMGGLDTYSEDSAIAFLKDAISNPPVLRQTKPLSDESLKIEGIRQAIQIGRMYSPNINANGIMHIADKVASFIRYYKLKPLPEK